MRRSRVTSSSVSAYRHWSASVSAIAYGRTGPTVLTVNSTGGDLTAFSP